MRLMIGYAHDMSSKITRPTVPPSFKAICRLFYSKITSSKNIWKCKCGVDWKCDVIKNGYNNLMTHVKSKHPDYLDIYAAHSLESSSSRSHFSNDGVELTTLEYMVDSKSRGIYKWLDWIVMDEHELSFCEKDHTRENMNLPKICSKTLKKYMFMLVDVVEKKITTLALARSRYALIFDGCTEDFTHFLGLFITIPTQDKASSSFHIYLLAFAPFLDKTTFIAVIHRDFIPSTLDWYQLPISNLICLIGDNCSTNCATTDLLGFPLLGCRSHCLNLAVEAYID